MANIKKFRSDELIGIIEKYVQNTRYLSKIKYSDLVKYGSILGYENLTYFDFTRDKEAKVLVTEFNKAIKLTDYNKYNLNNNDDIKPIKLDVNYVVDNYASDKRTQKAILNMYKDNYSKLCGQLEEAKKNQIASINELEKKEKENESLKLEIVKLKKEKEKILSEDHSVSLDIKRVVNALEYLVNKKCVKFLSEADFQNIIGNTLKVKKNDMLETRDSTEEKINLKKDRNVINLDRKLFD